MAIRPGGDWRGGVRGFSPRPAESRALEVLLQRAEGATATCRALIRQIEEQERIALQQAYGHVEPRKRFKKYSGHPLHEGRSVNLLFIAECGLAHVEPQKTYPTTFALGAVTLSPEAAEAYRMAADAVKLRFFGRTDITFHEPEMQQARGPYFFGGDTQKQVAFQQAIEELIANTQFSAFGVGIRKRAFEREFIATGIDPYLPTNVYTIAILLSVLC